MVAVSPTLRAITSLMGAFEFEGDEKHAAFKLGGKERWAIDLRRFGGSPVLNIERNTGSILVSLTNAMYPGTELPADLICELSQGIAGWRMRLRLALGGFESEVPLERWLSGAEPARSRVSIDKPVCRLGASSGISISGAGEAEFLPNWVLRLSGPILATLYGLGADVFSNDIAVSLLEPGEPSIIDGTTGYKRTLVSLQRGDQVWRLHEAITAPGGWKPVASSPFDTISVETTENKTGLARRALVAESGRDEARLFFQMDGDFAGDGGEPFALPLQNARYAVAFDPSGDYTALVARFHDEPVWLHANGCSLQLGHTPGAEPFELIGSNGKLKKMSCAPALLSVAAPLSDAVVEPTRVPEGTVLRFKIPRVLGAPPQLGITPPGAAQTGSDTGKIVQGNIHLPNYSVTVLRPEDMLHLRFEFVNLTLKTGSAALVRTGTPAYIIVHFPPQNIAEQAFFQAENPSDSEPPGPLPIKSMISGPSRLVFTVPAGVNEIPYTLKSLLAWEGFEQSVAPVALPPPLPKTTQLQNDTIYKGNLQKKGVGEIAPQTGLFSQDVDITPLWGAWTAALNLEPKIEPPAENHTAIETPYRLILSPNKFAGWAHSIDHVTHTYEGPKVNKTELWHTRLGVRAPLKSGGFTVDEQAAYLRTLRAVWSPDYVPGGTPPPNPSFTISLDSRERNEIVRLTSDYDLEYVQPIQANRLMLSALGAWMNTRGVWELTDNQLNVEEWSHRATMGRDHYVRVVKKGYLFPFGHRASVIKITERKFEKTPSGRRAAYLRQYKFIIVREPEKVYPRDGVRGRQMPFKRVRITTLITPKLDKVDEFNPFWPQVSDNDFQFHLLAEDWDGQRSEFTAPLMWIPNSLADNHNLLQGIANNYTWKQDAQATARRRRPMHGQKVAFAESTGGKPGDTTFETASVTFAADIPPQAEKLPQGQPRFFPRLLGAEVHLAAAAQVSGSSAPSPVAIRPYAGYVLWGYQPDKNQGEVFAVLPNPVPLDFQTNRSGGVVTPNMNIGGLSRRFGAIGGKADDLNALANGNAADFFKKFFSDAKILGGISLADIIPNSFLGGANIPRLTSRTIYENGDPLGKQLAVETTMFWKPNVQSSGAFVADGPGHLTVDAKMTTYLNGADPTYEITGELKNFTMNLVFISIAFNSFTFIAGSGQKLDLSAVIQGVKFNDPLSFVNKLEEYIDPAGFKDPPSLDVTADGATLGYTLAIPSVAVGVFSLQNISFSAGLHLPFTGDPVRLRFAFAERHNPFTLAVSLFAGGGFFGIALGLDGVEMLEGALEFGGNISLDIGVASGGVYVMAGIYYKMEADTAQLTGYLRCGGGLEVLGLICISVEFYLGLSYDTQRKKVWGEATVTVEIEIAFFSKSVDLTVERSFSGSNGDPTFKQLMGGMEDVKGEPNVDLKGEPPLEDGYKNYWEIYCDAFAPIVDMKGVGLGA